MRNAKVVSISLPQDLHSEVFSLAEEERRSISEVFREALRQYAAQRSVATIRKQAHKAAKSKKIKEEHIEDLIDESRT